MIRAFLLALAVLSAAPSARAEAPVWVVRDRDSELVLVGSVHLLPPGLPWKTAALDALLARADDLWFELHEDSATEAETARVAQRLGTLAPDQSLFRLLPPADAEALLKAAKVHGLDPVALDRLQPWLAEVAVVVAAFRRAGASATYGVEAAVQAATPVSVARRAFETPQEQLSVAAETPLDEQIIALRETLNELEKDPDPAADLIRAWMAKDLRWIERETMAPMRKVSPGLYERLVDARNARWARTLDARLKGSGRTVVVVGVAHLIGRQGVPARLRALGYSVSGP